MTKIIMKYALSLIFVMLSVGVSVAKVPDIVLTQKKAVVTLYIEQNKKIIASGSGFIISSTGIIVTNNHVIEPWNKIKDSLLYIKNSDGTFLTPLEVISSDAIKDVAILKVKEKNLPFISLSDITPKEGDDVVVIGSPLGLETSISTGIISSIRGEDEFLQISAPVSPGSSGSPVLNANGEAIGMATLIMTGGQNLNFAIPVSYLITISAAEIASQPKAKELRKASEVASAGYGAQHSVEIPAGDGDKSKSGDNLDSILTFAEQTAEQAKEIARLKADANRTRTVLILEDVSKYQQIVDNRYAQDMKHSAWDALVAAYPETKGTTRYDVKAFLTKLGIKYDVNYFIRVITGSAYTDKKLTEGESFIDLYWKDVNGKDIKLSDYAGKVIVLYFWASWAPPSKEEVPSLSLFNLKMKGKPVKIIGVSIDVKLSEVHKYVINNEVSFQTIMDQSGLASNAYGITGVPEAFIINKKGIVVKKIVGSIDNWTDTDVIDYFTALVKD